MLSKHGGLPPYEARIIQRLILNEPVDAEELAQVKHPGLRKVLDILLNNPENPTKALAQAVQADPELRETTEYLFAMPTNDKGEIDDAAGVDMEQMVDVMAEPVKPIEWLVDGIIATNTMMILGGRPKAGKSFLALELAIALDEGKPLLDRATRQSRVGLLTLEDGRERLKRRSHEMGWKPQVAAVGFKLRPLTGADCWGMLQIESLARKYDVLIIDSLIKSLGAGVNENDNVQMGQIINKIADISHELDTAIVVIHHTNKVGGDDPFLSLRGASAIRGGYDCALLMERELNAKEALLHIEQRDAPGTTLAITQRDNGMGWQLVGSGHVQTIKAGGKTIGAMLELDPEQEGLTLNAIADHRGTSVSAVWQQLRKAEKRGYVYRRTRVAPEGEGKPVDVWFVAEPYRE